MIAYDRLSQIIPADIALANKAMQVALEQIGGISEMTLPTLANTVLAVQTNKDLPAINQQTQPIDTATKVYILTNLGLGTGPCGTILIVDCLGTAIGTVITGNLSSTLTQLNTMDTSYLQLCYTTITNTLNGVYTVEIPPVDPMDPPTYEVTIPGGLPAAGTYGPYATATLAIQDAVTNGLIPATQSTLSGYLSTYPTQTTQMNSDFANICQQMGNEQDLQYRAGLRFEDFFANVTPNCQPATYSFIFGLPGYGQQTTQGGAAEFIQGIADYNPTTGTITIDSATVSNVSTFLGIVAGNTISGANIPAGTTVSSFNTGAKTITMSQAANATIQNSDMVVGVTAGQAIIGVMRQGISQTAIANAGVLTNTNIPLGTTPPQPQAVLLPSIYTAQQAANLVVK